MLSFCIIGKNLEAVILCIKNLPSFEFVRAHNIAAGDLSVYPVIGGTYIIGILVLLFSVSKICQAWSLFVTAPNIAAGDPCIL